ncbi:MAG: hypothetical protein AAGD13_17365 [Pseudomonadota bacterium]
MSIRFLRLISRVSCALGLAAVCAAPTMAKAEESIFADLLNVSIRIAGVADRSPSENAFSGNGLFESATSIDGIGAPSSAALPSSMYLGGLAGALNLAIDTTTGRPRVDGIVLAPSEILRFSAGHHIPIPGMQGHVAIRLDF